MTDDETQRPSADLIDSALERHAGDRQLVAEELGVTTVWLKDKIENNQVLSRWIENGNTDLPTADISIDRKEIHIDELREQEAIMREQTRIRKGLKGFQLTDEEIDLALAFQEFGRNEIGAVMQLALGGATKTCLRMSKLIERIEKRLLKTQDKLDDETLDVDKRGELAVEEKNLMSAYASIASQQNKFFDKTFQAATKLALVNFTIKNGALNQATVVKSRPPARRFQDTGGDN